MVYGVGPLKALEAWCLYSQRFRLLYEQQCPAFMQTCMSNSNVLIRSARVKSRSQSALGEAQHLEHNNGAYLDLAGNNEDN